MEINRQNYEMYFLLYADNELDTVKKEALETFVANHADLREELNLLLQTRLTADETIAFPNKENLFKPLTLPSTVHPLNYEASFLSYIDGELNEQEQKAVEAFLIGHPQKKAELARMRLLKLEPDNDIVFPGKNSLYKTDKIKAPVIGISWRRMAAAASIMAAGLLLWLSRNNNLSPQPGDPLQIVEKKQIQKASVPDDPGEAETFFSQPEENSVNDIVNKSAVAEQSVAGDTRKPLLKSTRDRLPAGARTIARIDQEQADADAETALPDVVKVQTGRVVPGLETQNEIAVPPTRLAPFDPPVAKPVGLSENEIQSRTVGPEEHTGDVPGKSKRTLGELLGKATRFVDRVTRPDVSDEQSVVRIAAFAIPINQ